MDAKETMYNELKKAKLVGKEIGEYTVTDLNNIAGQFKDKLSKKALANIIQAGKDATGEEEADKPEENLQTRMEAKGVSQDDTGCMKKDTVCHNDTPSVKVTIAHSFADILKWDQAGCKIVFDDTDEGVFKRLTEKEVRELSHTAARSYFIAEHFVDGKLARAEDFTSPLKFDGPKPGSAGAMLKAKEYEKGGLHMYPATPEEVDARIAMGYKKVGPLVTKNGKTELVEMVIPKEKYENHIRTVADESVKMIKRKVKEPSRVAKETSGRIGRQIPFREESELR